MDEDWAGSRSAFTGAAQWCARTVALVGDRWDAPGLGEWTVRDLVGHTSRSLTTVRAYLSAGPVPVERPDAAAYFSWMLAQPLAGAAVAQRGRDAGAALGDDPAAAVVRLVEEVCTLVAGLAPDAGFATPAGGMTALGYLPTRTFELVVHTCDLAVALGLEPRPPAGPATSALATVAGLAARDPALSGPLLLTATGRGALPAGFTVL